MSLSAKKKKGILLFNLGGAAIGGACCGLSFVPWGGSGGANGPRTLKYGSWYPRFVLGSIEEGESNGIGIKMPRELYIVANDSLRQKNSSEEIFFDDVTMKLGIKQLKTGDVLVKANEGDGYYFAEHIWDTQFRLDNGERKTWDQLSNSSGKLSDKTNGQAAKPIKLKLQTSESTSGGATITKLFQSEVVDLS